MQLLRDNLTLWTSSDNAEAEGAAAPADAPKKEEGEATDKPAEEAKAEEPAPEATN
jgi:14-3-3 protein epsilon